MDQKRCDCKVNKTPLAAITNRIIGANPPSVYLARLQKSAGIDDDRMSQILRSHVIDPAIIRLDDFEAFFRAGENAFRDRTENAMGKPVSREGIALELERVETS